MLNSMLKIFVGPVMGGFEPPPTPPSIRHWARESHCNKNWGKVGQNFSKFLAFCFVLFSLSDLSSYPRLYVDRSFV
jgi:hypothetical protein